MPRDGLQQYAPPPGTNGITNYTIESTKYNGFVADVTQDLNLPRPIVAGGTGANNARDAMTSLQGDVAYQVVTNYDAYAFVSGSFYSAAGATSAPTANAFIGQCYTSDPAVVPPAVPAGQNMFIEARDVTTGINYIRQKTAGVWGAWKQQTGNTADLDAAYVNVAGDTMTGPLTLTGATGVITASSDIISGASVQSTSYITSGRGGTTGTYYFGNSGTKYLQYDGANFNLAGGPLKIADATASASSVTGALTVAGGAGVSGALNVGAAVRSSSGYYFGTAGAQNLNFDGTNFNLVGGPLKVADTTTASSATTGALTVAGGVGVGGTIVSAGSIRSSSVLASGLHYFGSGDNYCLYDGANFNLVGGPLSATGHKCRTGLAGAYTADWFNLNYNAGPVQMWISTTNLGNITITSDYRIKKDVLDLPGMWDTVKALRPIKYTQAQFSPPSHIKFVAEEALKARKEAEENPDAKPREVSTAPMFEADDIERWGFIAHELQETLIPSAANGVKDAPDEIQSPNPFTVIAALTKALQEAMTRIEALEAR